MPDKDCLLPLMSKVLGYCIVAASTTVKLPQVRNFFSFGLMLDAEVDVVFGLIDVGVTDHASLTWVWMLCCLEIVCHACSVLELIYCSAAESLSVKLNVWPVGSEELLLGSRRRACVNKSRKLLAFSTKQLPNKFSIFLAIF